jgi:hypothetical protein
VTAATTSAGYIMAKFRRAKLPPFDLVRGDPKENLRNWQQRPEAPSDPTSQKIWRLLKLGYSVPKLLDALKLSARCSWSTSVAEQGHALASSLVRGHRMCGSRTVQGRALVIAARALFSTTATERKLRLAEASLASLGRKRPGRFAGRQWVLRDMTFALGPMRLFGKHAPRGFATKLIFTHGAKWVSISDDLRRS